MSYVPAGSRLGWCTFTFCVWPCLLARRQGICRSSASGPLLLSQAPYGPTSGFSMNMKRLCALCMASMVLWCMRAPAHFLLSVLVLLDLFSSLTHCFHACAMLVSAT